MINSRDIQSTYLTSLFCPERLETVIDDVVKMIGDTKFDAIACRGMSGSLVASIVSLRLKKPLIIVRKQKKGHHSRFCVEGYLPQFKDLKYIIIDDLVHRGITVTRIIQKIRNERGRGSFKYLTECVGLYLYDGGTRSLTCTTFGKFIQNNVYGKIVDSRHGIIYDHFCHPEVVND